jgi:outer membrane protein assembly factor BamB/serine/threonine protein kinase
MADFSGQQLGNYRLRHLLGRGGYADVYLGEHIHLETLAAIKVLDIRMGSNELADFLREARTIAHLLHPCIVRVLDFGVEGNMPFLVMDYAPNGTLRQRYPKGTCLPLLTIISYVTQVAQALQYAHNRKVIHRDVKPENMLLGINNQVLLSDFGISIIEQNTSILITQKRISSSPTGTCYYMAPEQIQGSAHSSSDQYALGIVVYEWLCGSRPFSGEFFAVMYQHVNVPPPPLREKIPEISPAVEHVVLRALAKDPQQRFATIEDFAKALEQASQAQGSATLPAWPLSIQPALNPLPVQQVSQAQGSETLLARSRSEQPVLNPVQQARQRQEAVILPAWPRRAPEPIGIVEPVHRRRGLFTGKAMLLVGLALIIVVGSVAFLLSTSNKGSNAKLAVDTHATATATAEVLAHASATASLRATATAAINAYNVATASGIMLGFNAQHTHVNPYERALTTANVAMLTQAWKANTGGSIGSASTVANGIVYISSSGGKMYAINAGTGEVLWNKPIGSFDFGCAPTVANGVVYMGGFDHQLYALDSKTGATLWTALTKGRIGSSPTLANGVIYVGSDDGSLYAFEASTGKQRWSVPIGSYIRSSPAVANGVVYVGSDDKNLYAIKADTGTILWKVLTGDKIRSSPAIANGVVYVGSDDKNLYAVKADTGTILWKVLTGDKIRSSPAIANGVVYVGSEDRKLYAFEAATGKLHWSFLSRDTIDSSPAIANGVLYIGSNDHKLYAFNASGCTTASCTPLWTVSTGGPVSASPTVANGFVYIGSNDGNLYAFHLIGVTP